MRRIFILRSLSQYRLSTILYHTVLNIIYKMQVPLTSQIAKGRLLTGQEQGCNRLTQLVGLVLSCPKWPKNRKMVVVCPIVITSIGDTLFQTRPDQEWGIIGQASLLHGWHWVLSFYDSFDESRTVYLVLLSSASSSKSYTQFQQQHHIDFCWQ